MSLGDAPDVDDAVNETILTSRGMSSDSEGNRDSTDNCVLANSATSDGPTSDAALR